VRRFAAALVFSVSFLTQRTVRPRKEKQKQRQTAALQSAACGFAVFFPGNSNCALDTQGGRV
jgi:hypothetical protein